MGYADHNVHWKYLNRVNYPEAEDKEEEDKKEEEDDFVDETKPYFKHILLPRPVVLLFFTQICILFP